MIMKSIFAFKEIWALYIIIGWVELKSIFDFQSEKVWFPSK